MCFFNVTERFIVAFRAFAHFSGTINLLLFDDLQYL